MKLWSTMTGVLAACALAQGCALTDATLEVGHDPALARIGPLSETSPQTFVLNELSDAREDQERVGNKKNGFEQNMGDITTASPVTTLIADAIDAAVVANSHTLGDADVAIDGVVNQFWVEVDINFANIEMFCTIDTKLTFNDSATQDTIYSANYSGSYSDRKQVGTESNYVEIITGAIQSLIDDIVFDAE